MAKDTMALSTATFIMQKCKDDGTSKETAIAQGNEYIRNLELTSHEREYALTEVQTIADRIFKM